MEDWKDMNLDSDAERIEPQEPAGNGIYDVPPMIVLNALCLLSAVCGLRLLAREYYRAHMLLLYFLAR